MMGLSRKVNSILIDVSKTNRNDFKKMKLRKHRTTRGLHRGERKDPFLPVALAQV